MTLQTSPLATYPATAALGVCPRGTYLPYFFTFLLKDLFLLKAPSIGSPACMAALMASARIACSGKYRDVTLPALPALPVRPTCTAHMHLLFCNDYSLFLYQLSLKAAVEFC